MLQAKQKNIVQPKLKIGQPGDKYEREADRVADAVMRMPDPQVQMQSSLEDEEQQLQMQPKQSDLIQMKQQAPELQGMCPRCRKRARQGRPLDCPDCEKKLQMTPAIQRQGDGQTYASTAITSQLLASEGQGAPLPSGIQREMSDKIGADFGNVNIHTGSKAIQMNKALGARAFTHGRDIYFNRGQYDPASSGGKHLLAHELTHVVQQGPGLHTSSSSGLIQRSCDIDFTGYSDETCEGTIHVGATTISQPLAGYYHLFILYTDSSGSRFYLRGGPESSGGSYGSIITLCAHYDESEREYDERNILEEVYQGTDACNKLRSMQSKLNEIEDWQVPYVPAGPNSNSVVATLLGAAGLPHRKPAVPAPGFEMEVTSSGGEESEQDRPTLLLLSLGGGNGLLLSAEVQQRLHTFSPLVGPGIPIPIPLELDMGFYTFPVQERFGGTVGLSTDVSVLNLPLPVFSPLGITLGGGFTAGGRRTEDETGTSETNPEIGGYARAGVYVDINRFRLSPQYQFNFLQNLETDTTTPLHSFMVQLGYTF